jgi:ABC-2 type transport system permease protein
VNELGALFALEWRRLRSSARVVVLALLYLASCAVFLLVFGRISTGLQAQLDSALSDPAQAQFVSQRLRDTFLGALLGSSDPEALRSLAKVPILIFIGFRAALLFFPVWIALLGYDAVSDELATRSIRYVSVRARRGSILLGKYLALGSALLALLLLLNLELVFFARQLNPQFNGGLLWLTLLRCWGACTLFALGYLGLTLLCSTLVRSPALALALNITSLGALFALSFLGERGPPLGTASAGDAPAVGSGYLRLLSPFEYGPLLLNPEPGPRTAGVVGFLVFILLGVGAALFVLRRRDL